MVTKKKPAARSFYCPKCAKKRKMPFLNSSGFFGTKTYECTHCGSRKVVG